MTTKKHPDELRFNKFVNQAKREVVDFESLINRFERNLSVLGRSTSIFFSSENNIL
jgi:hypothetical protein